MKRHQLVYTDRFRPSPVSYWIHRPLDSDIWLNANDYDPPLPRPVPARGWSRLEIEFNGVLLEFASRAEVEHVIEVLSRNPLPTTRRLSNDRGGGRGPNSHWLSRLPARAKPRKFRESLVKYLRYAVTEHENFA